MNRRAGYRRTTRAVDEIRAIRESLFAPEAPPSSPARRAPRKRALDEEHARLMRLSSSPGPRVRHVQITAKGTEETYDQDGKLIKGAA